MLLSAVSSSCLKSKYKYLYKIKKTVKYNYTGNDCPAELCPCVIINIQHMDNTHTTNTSNRMTKRSNLSSIRSSSPTGIMGYSRIKITNETPHAAVGIIMLTSSLKNAYAVTSNQTWEAPDRELSLLTAITAVLTLNDGSTVRATPYISSAPSGTGFSRFRIVQDQHGYRVVRNTLWNVE